MVTFLCSNLSYSSLSWNTSSYKLKLLPLQLSQLPSISFEDVSYKNFVVYQAGADPENSKRGGQVPYPPPEGKQKNLF